MSSRSENRSRREPAGVPESHSIETLWDDQRGLVQQATSSALSLAACPRDRALATLRRPFAPVAPGAFRVDSRDQYPSEICPKTTPCPPTPMSAHGLLFLHFDLSSLDGDNTPNEQTVVTQTGAFFLSIQYSWTVGWVSSMRNRFVVKAWFPILLLLIESCRAAATTHGVNAVHSSASTGSLASAPTAACQNDGDCGVCYREGSCGDALALSDPALETPACHVPPAAFCLARRGHCDNSRCVAR